MPERFTGISRRRATRARPILTSCSPDQRSGPAFSAVPQALHETRTRAIEVGHTGLSKATGRRSPLGRSYKALLRYAGCTATSPEYAGMLGGDDIALRSSGDLIDGT